MSEDKSEHEIGISPKLKQSKSNDDSDIQNEVELYAMPSLDEILAEGERCELNNYLNNIDLPDQSIAEVDQKQVFIIKEKLIKKIIADAKDAAQQAAYKTMSEHPEVDGLDFKFAGRVYAEKYKGVNLSLAFTHILDCIVHRRAALTSQKAILDSVKISTGIRELNANIWTMQLKKFIKAQLYKRLSSYGLQISLASCTSMSEVRKAIDAYFAKKQAVHKLKLDLTITPNEIIVNGNTHKISTVSSGGYEYRKIRLLVNDKRTWLNVNDLKILFGLAA